MCEVWWGAERHILFECKPIFRHTWKYDTSYMNSSIATKLALIPVWINNYIRFKMCDENTYPSPNCNGAAVEVWEWVSDFITFYWACDYLSMLWHRFIYVNTRCPSNPFSTFSPKAKNSIGTSSEYVHEITNNYTPYFLWHVIIHHCPNLTAIYLKHHWNSLSLKNFVNGFMVILISREISIPSEKRWASNIVYTLPHLKHVCF